MPDDSNSGSIAARLLRVLEGLDSIPKNGTAPANQGGYAFRRVEDVTAALKPLFVEHGLVCTPRMLARLDNVRTTKSGGNLYVTALHIEWTFRDDTGATLIASMWGEGSDSGDKATQKAVTASLKSLFTPTFLISDESDDAEAHDVEDSAPAKTPAQQQQDRKAAWGDKPLPEGWASFEAMDEKHRAFETGVKSLPPEEVKAVGEFRSAKEIPWPMSVDQMEVMLGEVMRLKDLRAATTAAGQEAADGPGGQGG